MSLGEWRCGLHFPGGTGCCLHLVVVRNQWVNAGWFLLPPKSTTCLPTQVMTCLQMQTDSFPDKVRPPHRKPWSHCELIPGTPSAVPSSGCSHSPSLSLCPLRACLGISSPVHASSLLSAWGVHPLPQGASSLAPNTQTSGVMGLCVAPLPVQSFRVTGPCLLEPSTWRLLD